MLAAVDSYLGYFHDPKVPSNNLLNTLQVALNADSTGAFWDWWERYKPELDQIQKKTPFSPNNVFIACPDGFVFERLGKMIFAEELPFHDHEFRSTLALNHRCGEKLRQLSFASIMSGRMDDPRRFWGALHALEVGNWRYFEHPIIPLGKKDLKQSSDFDCFSSSLREGDIIASANPDQFTSKLIGALDLGYWSHVAGYDGNSQVVEAVPGKGVHKFHVTEYLQRVGHHAIYRSFESDLGDYKSRLASKIGGRYNYRGAFLLGWSLFRAGKSKSHRRKMLLLTSGRISPNGFIMSGKFYRDLEFIVRS